MQYIHTIIGAQKEKGTTIINNKNTFENQNKDNKTINDIYVETLMETRIIHNLIF